MKQKRDLEGGILWKKWDKIAGDGDYFLTDDFERLIEVKQGVTNVPDSNATSYALDQSQNWSSRSETRSNRILDVNESGLLSPYVYDQNGNLVHNGYQLHMYDYLNPLCKTLRYLDMARMGTAGGASLVPSRSAR